MFWLKYVSMITKRFSDGFRKYSGRIWSGIFPQITYSFYLQTFSHSLNCNNYLWKCPIVGTVAAAFRIYPVACCSLTWQLIHHLAEMPRAGDTFSELFLSTEMAQFLKIRNISFTRLSQVHLDLTRGCVKENAVVPIFSRAKYTSLLVCFPKHRLGSNLFSGIGKRI